MNQQRSMLDAVLDTIVRVRRRVAAPQVGSIEEDCADLLRLGTDAGKRVGKSILARYAALDAEEKNSFFHFLADSLDIDSDRLVTLAETYRDERTPANLKLLQEVGEPRRQELLRRLNTLPGATAEIVRMREDLFSQVRNEPDLERVDLDFAHLFASWFNRGFLELQRISWDSSASVLAKIIAYEAVHEINGWSDLRSRLQPSDRRCYAFFHPAMPGEPLVFTEVALVRGVPGSVQQVLDEERDELAAEEADTAVFYSISNCQKGLRGISFGNLLIKQVVADLGRELPNLKTFVTLSPLPRFGAWLEAENLADEDPDVLLKQAAYYLVEAKNEDKRPLDPVARFHLANGAQVHAVHANADTSTNGMQQSIGVMVNYLYDLSEVESNQEAFASDGHVAASKPVRALATAYGKASS